MNPTAEGVQRNTLGQRRNGEFIALTQWVRQVEVLLVVHVQ